MGGRARGGHASATGHNTGITNPSHPWFIISNHITNSHYEFRTKNSLTSTYVLATGSNQQRTNNVNNPPFFACRRKGTISGSGTALGAITPTNMTNVAMRTLPLPVGGNLLVRSIQRRVQRITIKISTYPTHEIMIETKTKSVDNSASSSGQKLFDDLVPSLCMAHRGF